MNYLAIDTSGDLLVIVNANGKKTVRNLTGCQTKHSLTLMPYIEEAMEELGVSLNNLDFFAVVVGPGSFTGIRIGISAVKGLAAPKNIPCCSVSTLGAMAECFSDRNCIVCAVMDARCNQFYNALFEIKDGIITRLCDDRALLSDELKQDILNISSDKKIIVCGDGADLFYKNVSELKNVHLAPQYQKFQSAVGIGLYAYKNFDVSNTVTPEQLLPIYLRLPQAERELKAKTEAVK